LPDIDLLYLPLHRMATHSVTATLVITIVAAAVTGWVTGRVSWPIAITCGAAYATHLLLDWVGADASAPYGIQPFWPFSSEWFISPWSLFPGTERRDPFSLRAVLINSKALVAEIVILGPVVVMLWFRRKRRSPGPISGRDARQPPSA
jgi:inner membrane protein